MPSRNMIRGVKYCRFWTFDLWRSSWILPQLINSCANLFVWSRSLFMPNFVQIRWTGSKCLSKMWFVESNLVDFGPLTSGGHLGFCDKWKILAQACFKGQVVFPCQILSSSDEREPNAEPNCYLWGQIWSILDFWPLVAILNIAINEKFLLRLVYRVT